MQILVDKWNTQKLEMEKMNKQVEMQKLDNQQNVTFWRIAGGATLAVAAVAAVAAGAKIEQITSIFSCMSSAFPSLT